MTSQDGPSIRRAKIQAGHLATSVLQDDETRNALRKFKTLVDTSRGPWGYLKMLHNDVGGHVTLTSVSSRIFGGLSVKNPLLKLLMSCVQGHIQAYSDGGLFAADLALSLTLNSLDLDIHPRLVTDVFEYLMFESLSFLKSPPNKPGACIYRFDTCDLSDLRNLSRTIFSSKPGCDFWPGELEHISSLLVTAFLRTSTKESPHSLQYLTIEGMPCSESYIADGMIHQMPSIPTYRTKPLSMIRNHGQILVAVFNVSFAGDTSENLDSDIIASDSTLADDVILGKIVSLCESLVELGVGIVACQRVVHPEIKRRLRRNNIFVMDRLGIHHIYSFQELTGATLIGSFTGSVTFSDLGVLDDIQHKVIDTRSYVHLLNKSSPVCTLVLCGRSEESLADIKTTCQTGYHVLQMAWQDGVVLSGGGCWQNVVAASMWKKVKDTHSMLTKDLGCSSLQLQTISQVFCKSLSNCLPMQTASDRMMDSAHHHTWHVPQSNKHTNESGTQCACGIITTDPTQLLFIEDMYTSSSSCISSPVDSEPLHIAQVDKPYLLDSYSASVNALRVGVSSAIMILNIQNVIQDIN